MTDNGSKNVAKFKIVDSMGEDEEEVIILLGNYLLGFDNRHVLSLSTPVGEIGSVYPSQCLWWQ
jgi:hypothetical protein